MVNLVAEQQTSRRYIYILCCLFFYPVEILRRSIYIPCCLFSYPVALALLLFFCSCVHVSMILLFLLCLSVSLLSSLSRICNARFFFFFFFKENGYSNDSRSLRFTRNIRACVHPLYCSFENMPQIQYSEKYFDDVHEYRYVPVSLCPSH